MLNANEMTQQQALLGVLVLALTADTKKNAAKAGELADDIAYGLSAVEIKVCQDMAVEIQDLADSMHWAVAPHNVASLAAGTCGITGLDDENSLLVFENEADRDAFVRDQDEAELPSIHVVCEELTKRYQRKLVDE